MIFIANFLITPISPIRRPPRSTFEHLRTPSSTFEHLRTNSFVPAASQSAQEPPGRPPDLTFKGFYIIFIIFGFFHKIGLNRLYKALNLIKLYKKIPLQHILTRGSYLESYFLDIKKYFAYKPYFNHITRYFRCNFQNQREKTCRVMGSNLI